jgi:predicted O-methyltransferase YrrM
VIKETIRSTVNSFGYDIMKLETAMALRGQSSVKAQNSNVFDPNPENRAGEEKLITDHKTFNPSHPRYDARHAKNFPGTLYSVLNATVLTEQSRLNPFFQKIYFEKMLSLASDRPQRYDFLRDHINAAKAELQEEPYYKNFLSKMAQLDAFVDILNKKGPGKFNHGGVSLDDGAFLYWLVRTARPKKVVQTGTSNGISCAFITMALAKNGDGGKLFAVDWPHIYNEADPFWKQTATYGVVIPTGKSSGWLVPDQLSSSFEVRTGDAKKVLPPYLDEIGEIDMFYHDSDHTYNHMWFEFEEAFPHIRKNGLILADDIAWSTVTWDFAQQIGAYAFNHCGSQGIIFL